MDEMQINAYVDGELDATARSAFERRLAADAGLRRRVDSAQSLRAMLGAAYAPVLEEPVPARLHAALNPKVVWLDARRRWRPTWAQLGGMAASVMLGLVIGHRIPGYQIGTPQNALTANGQLSVALDGKLSGERLGAVSVGLSFAAKGGGYCRSFVMDGSAGLACRDGDAWRVRQLMPAPPAQQGEYRTAATALPPALLATIDEMREGDVLDARQEAEAKAKGWR